MPMMSRVSNSSAGRRPGTRTGSRRAGRGARCGPSRREVLGGGDVDDGAGCRPADAQRDGAGGGAAEVEEHPLGVGGLALDGAGLGVVHRAHRIGGRSPDRDGAALEQCRLVPRPTGERGAHGRAEHAERLARRVDAAAPAAVHRRDLVRLAPGGVVEAGAVPAVGMHPRVEPLEREGGRAVGQRHRRPRLPAHRAPRAVGDDPLVADQRLERQRADAQRVARGHRHPPRRGRAEVAGDDGDDVLADHQVGRQVDHVVVGLAGLAAHRAPRHLDAVDAQDVAAVDPDPGRGRGRHRVELDDAPEQRDVVGRVGVDRLGDRLEGDGRRSVPHPTGAPTSGERLRMFQLHDGGPPRRGRPRARPRVF